MPLPEALDERAAWIVEVLGPHPARALGLSLDQWDETALRAWLIASALHAPRADERLIEAAHRALEEQGGRGATDWFARDPVAVEARLERAGHPRAAETAALLARLAVSLREIEDRHRGLGGLLGAADSLEGLGGALSRLAPGFGRAAVARFLQPLRAHWPVCSDLPLDPAAAAAAAHLGLIAPETEPEFAAEGLRRVLPPPADGTDGVPALADLEAALARLGRRACQRSRVASCPLEDDCPLA